MAVSVNADFIDKYTDFIDNSSKEKRVKGHIW